MDQRTHAWLAIRAVGLLDDAGAAPGLVSLLKPHVRNAAIGSWIPDLQDDRAGGGDIDNHVMKMKPYSGKLQDRFVVGKNDLLKKLGPGRRMSGFIRDRSEFTAEWWNTPYKAEPQPGQHLANRAMSLGVTLADLLILGDTQVARLVPGDVAFATSLDVDARTRSAQAATYFFMLSHFLADSCMPCHCDARPLAAFSNGLHNNMEKHWAAKVGDYFDKRELLATTDTPVSILAKARNVDDEFGGLGFTNEIPGIKKGSDIWYEIMNVCRGSFVINSIIAPPDTYGYKSAKKAPFATVFKGEDGERLLDEMDKAVIHDAVLNTAIVWKYVWDKFK